MNRQKSLFVELYGKPRQEWTLRDHLTRLWVWRQEIGRMAFVLFMLGIGPLVILLVALFGVRT